MIQALKKQIYLVLGLGVTPLLSLNEKQSVRIINGINLGIFFILLVLFFINTFSHNYAESLSNLLLIFLVCLPVFIWNHKQRYQLAKIHFTIGAFIIVIISTLTAYKAERFSETENISFLVGIAILLLFEGKLRFMLYLLLTAMLFGMKAIKMLLMNHTLDLLYFHALANTSIILIGIYFFSLFFKNQLLAGNASSEELMKQLKSQYEEIHVQNEEIGAQNDQLNAQQDLIDYQKNILRGLIDAIPLFIALLDKEGKYLIANKAYENAFQIPIKQIEGNHYSNVLTPELVERHRPLVERGLKGENSYFKEFTALPDGRATYFHGKYTPVFSADGSSVEFLAVFVDDITNLKETEEKLIASNKIKDKLFSIISHDLRSPLNSLISLLELAQTGFINEQEWKDYLADLNKSITYITQLLENLLKWSKSQISNQALSPKVFSFNEIVENNFHLFRKQAEQKQIQLSASNTDILVFADENSIDLVVRNLISNALKFSNFNSKIEITAEVKGKFATINVKDYGVGIPNEILEKLLKEELISTYGTNQEKGTGLGLMLCKEFIEKNGGKLSITSQEGIGSTFSFTIPLPSAEGE